MVETFINCWFLKIISNDTPYKIETNTYKMPHGSWYVLK